MIEASLNSLHFDICLTELLNDAFGYFWTSGVVILDFVVVRRKATLPLVVLRSAMLQARHFPLVENDMITLTKS